jgi:hypothetical protein
MTWKTGRMDRIREFFGMRPSTAELMRRKALIDAGNSWPPLPRPSNQPPPPPPGKDREPGK